MSMLWYRGYTSIGIPKEVAFRIATEIKKRNLGNYMPRICVEPSNRRNEFYFFIGVKSESINDLPTEVRDFEKWLSIQHIRVFPGGECVLHDDLTKAWLKREVDITYTRQLSSWKFQSDSFLNENPFDLSGVSIPEQGDQPAYNQLLYWLSAQREGSWQNFRNAWNELKIGQISDARHHFRRLRLLSHCEYLDNGGRWTICPPCFVNIESTDNRYLCFLAGGRSPQLLEMLANTKLIPQSSRGAPDAIFISFEGYTEAQFVSSEIFRQTGCSIQLPGNASLRLANLLPDIMGWQNTLLTKISVNSDRYKIHQWTGDDFSKWVDRPTEFGMYQLTDTIVVEKAPVYYFFYNPIENQWYQGDWYGLRYLGNRYLNNLPVLKHNSSEKLLFVPSSHRLPDIYEKALVLASGELPFSNDIGVIYKNITADLASIISAKLDAKI